MVAFANTFESKTPLRVRADRHSCILGASPCLYPNHQANLRNDTYDEFNRLESCSKDPIGYADGENLYRAYFVPSGVDPSGLAQLEFEFNAFINGDRGTWLPEPIISNFWEREFKTDERGFGQRGTSRISTKGAMPTCAIGFGSPGASTSVGASHMRRRTISINPCGLLNCTIAGPWVYYESTAPLDTDDIKGSFSQDPCKSTIRIKASAGYPFAPASPNIDYDVKFEFTVVGKDSVFVQFSGSHNRFPDYEAVLELGGSRTTMYQYRSPDSGPGFVNLNSSVSGAGASLVSVETPACCSSPEGSCGN